VSHETRDTPPSSEDILAKLDRIYAIQRQLKLAIQVSSVAACAVECTINAWILCRKNNDET
jgi:hypothetical protein